MDGAYAGAGENGNGQFRYHWHIDADSVAFADTMRFHHIGEPAHLFMQLTVGEGAVGLGRVVSFPKDGNLFAPGGQVAVDTVFSNVKPAS